MTINLFYNIIKLKTVNNCIFNLKTFTTHDLNNKLFQTYQVMWTQVAEKEMFYLPLFFDVSLVIYVTVL